ncbi:MAG: hypothetical protein LBK06_04540 [Planctomycetaceae bacterium]|jgi:hypothetical protein|nr:hypothetical protein [Planctomycetaceae bacterium]
MVKIYTEAGKAIGFALEQPLHVVALPCSALRILKRLQHIVPIIPAKFCPQHSPKNRNQQVSYAQIHETMQYIIFLHEVNVPVQILYFFYFYHREHRGYREEKEKKRKERGSCGKAEKAEVF